MSVLIKGMKIPNNCADCYLNHGAVCYVENRVVMDDCYDRRATWCPLIEVPFAQPEWISVTERLPNVNEEVLVYLWKDSPYIANIDDNGQWETNDFYIDKDDIPEFWMPLPEPYQEVEHE